jgi:uncharacterized protein (DUF2235 family)
MAKNIVVCCDGTGNEFGESNSNVVKLYQALVRSPEQLVYYHPGVGTMGAKNALTQAAKFWTKVRGLAFGYGLSDNILDAYQFLMQTFEPGDRVFIFGFSRGAYTARALCGMLRMFGLLSRGNEGLIPYALRLFKRDDSGIIARITARPSKFHTASGFKTTFSQACQPHFLGVWDTVSSVGWILDPIGLKPGRLPYTFDLAEIGIVRHAVSVDERRAFFRQNLVHENAARDIKQVWFAGVHSDVGGSYPEAESGLSKISLRWMMREAAAAGLQIDQRAVADLLGNDVRFVRPLATGLKHNSLTLRWWLGEFWPKWTKKLTSAPGVEPPTFSGMPRLNLFHRRFIPEQSCLHESIMARKQWLSDYDPTNLPATYTVEKEPIPDQYPVVLAVGTRLTVGVHARAKWNNTAISVSKGEKYRFEATGTWYDASIRSDPAGYESPSVLFRLVEWLRRAPKNNWFALIGSIGQQASAHFLIGNQQEKTITEDGIVYCFANDLPFLYQNNSGVVTLTVTRIS